MIPDGYFGTVGFVDSVFELAFSNLVVYGVAHWNFRGMGVMGRALAGSWMFLKVTFSDCWKWSQIDGWFSGT